jgi:SAM-dependent methyltransferase
MGQAVGEMIKAGHLGGYVTGGDPATFYPDLWWWLIQDHDIKSVVDVGCGDGVALRWFRGRGCSVVGVDGVAQSDPDIVCHDFTTASYTRSRDEFDLCWSCEFVEHVDEHAVHNFLDLFAQARLVLMTHAFPGQAGYHHVNCQPESYWRGAMAAIGYVLDFPMTVECRAKAASNRSEWNHFVRSGLAFRRVA